MNILLVHYLELLSHFHKRDAYIVLFKDFLAKRIAQFPHSKNNIIVHAKITQFKAIERTISKLPEYSFNLRELMDEKEIA